MPASPTKNPKSVGGILSQGNPAGVPKDQPDPVVSGLQPGEKPDDLQVKSLRSAVLGTRWDERPEAIQDWLAIHCLEDLKGFQIRFIYNWLRMRTKSEEMVKQFTQLVLEYRPSMKATALQLERYHCALMRVEQNRGNTTDTHTIKDGPNCIDKALEASSIEIGLPDELAGVRD